MTEKSKAQGERFMAFLNSDDTRHSSPIPLPAWNSAPRPIDWRKICLGSEAHSRMPAVRRKWHDEPTQKKRFTRIDADFSPKKW
jgi:hypothetical protein